MLRGWNWAICAGLWSVVTAAALPAHALTFNVTYDSSVAANFGSNTAAMESAFASATQAYQSLYTDPITINLTVSGSAGTSILGQSGTFLQGYDSYTAVRNALINDATTANDTSANASLPVSDPTGGHNYAMATAEAKALGLEAANNSATDGVVTFGAGFSYTFDPNHRAVSGKYDFIGVAEHEIAEVMGRIPGLGANFGDGGPDYLPFDLFRFDHNTTTRDFSNGNNIWFSINGGATDLLEYNYAGLNGGDAQDWAGATADSFNAFTSSGVENDISTADKQVMDVIGYNLASVPEPSTLALLGVGGIGAAVSMWRRRQVRQHAAITAP